VLGCSALAHLNLSENRIELAGAESLAGVLPQCAALAHLDLEYNSIGPDGAESLAAGLGQCAALPGVLSADMESGMSGCDTSLMRRNNRVAPL